MLDAAKAQAFDKIHSNILNKVGDPTKFSDKRVSGYLNPWHFLYIASALQKINDREAGTAYLQKAQSIIDQASNHQSPKIVSQKTLLEAVHTALRHGQVQELHSKRLKKTGHYSESSKDSKQRRNAAIRLHKSKQKQKEILLHSIETIYEQMPTGSERNRLIFHLNIPPFRRRQISGLSAPDRKVSHQTGSKGYTDIRGLTHTTENP
jgi:hypothetical protein